MHIWAALMHKKSNASLLKSVTLQCNFQRQCLTHLFRLRACWLATSWTRRITWGPGTKLLSLTKRAAIASKFISCLSTRPIEMKNSQQMTMRVLPQFSRWQQTLVLMEQWKKRLTLSNNTWTNIEQNWAKKQRSSNQLWVRPNSKKPAKTVLHRQWRTRLAIVRKQWKRQRLLQLGVNFY